VAGQHGLRPNAPGRARTALFNVLINLLP